MLLFASLSTPNCHRSSDWKNLRHVCAQTSSSETKSRADLAGHLLHGKKTVLLEETLRTGTLAKFKENIVANCQIAEVENTDDQMNGCLHTLVPPVLLALVRLTTTLIQAPPSLDLVKTPSGKSGWLGNSASSSCTHAAQNKDAANAQPCRISQSWKICSLSRLFCLVCLRLAAAAYQVTHLL